MLEGWDRHLQVLLVRADLPLDQPSSRDMYGTDLNHSGGTGRPVRAAQILWNIERTRIPPRLLEDGGTYELEFEHSPVEGNVRLRVRSRTAGNEWERHIAWPGREEKTTGDTAALAAGEYWFGVFCERQAWSTAEKREGVDVRIESLSLHAVQH